MALLFMEGWDGFAATDESIEADARYVSGPTANDYVIGSTESRFAGGGSLRVYVASSYLTYKIKPSNATIYGGFGFKADQFPNEQTIFRLVYNVDSTLDSALSIRTTAAGTLRVYRGDTAALLGTTTGTVSGAGWHYIVFKFFIDDTTGTVELWIDDTKELDLTSQDTKQGTGADVIDGITFSSTATAYTYFDDCYIGDTTGTDMTDQQGDCRVETLAPNADGNRNNFTRSAGVNNYENVDEGITDEDTTYNYGNTIADGELYGTGSITGSAGTVLAVQVQSVMRKEDAGGRTINSVCRSSTSESDGTAFGLTTDYRFYSDFFENDPNGGINWTETTANNAEVGIEIAS